MILGIEVLCEACGTELEITDVNTDHLLKVTLKARPCPKCNRPPDCQLSCEDVLGKEQIILDKNKRIKNLQELLKDDIDFDDDKFAKCSKCEFSYPSEECDNIGCNGS